MVRRPKTTRYVYIFIKKYIEDHTHPPTLREIGEGCFMSPSSVLRHLDKLEKEGMLFREEGKARGITLVDD
jgi:SOS-response transcriptional repressor LexA